jgi:hypothetical protein
MLRVFLRRLATAVPRGAVAVEPVKGGPRALARAVSPEPPAESCGTAPAADDDLADPVSNVDPKTGEWGGPTKGGSVPEPTRFGDWERKGRCSEFAAAEGRRVACLPRLRGIVEAWTPLPT